MDKLLYIAMSGAKENLNATAIRGNNLANAKTDGFKADMEQARAMQAFGEGMPTRVFAMTESPAQDFSAGPLITTGRDLDVAIEGKGWFVVQAADGSEAMTRAGALKIDPTGMLTNGAGHPVQGDNGPIFLPLPLAKVEVGTDGSISALPQGAPANAIETVGRLRLVNPDIKDLKKGNDGMFRMTNGQASEDDAGVKVVSGALEGSNVNSVSEMVDLISLQRQFDMQVKMMKTAEELDSSSDTLLRIS